MRIKNDVVIKYYQLVNTMNLSNEDLGLIFRNLIMEEDKNKIRYENANPRLLSIVEKKEKQWSEDFEKKLEEDERFASCYYTLSGQVKNSNSAFKKKQKEYDEKDKKREILKIMKTEECSFEDAVDIYNFQNMTFDKPKPEKPKPEKPKTEPKVEEKPKVAKRFKSDGLFDLTLNVSENCKITDKDIDEAVIELEGKYPFEELGNIIQNAIEKADNDDYINPLMSYIMCQIEDQVMSKSQNQVPEEKDEFPF